MRKSVWLMVLAGMLLSACAERTTTRAHASPATFRVEVGSTKNPRAVKLSPGDHLVLWVPVTLEGTGWTLDEWPKQNLSLRAVGGPASYPHEFIFTARAPGSGLVVAVNRSGCTSPPKAKPDPLCLLTRFTKADLSKYSPGRLFALTVVVNQA